MWRRLVRVIVILIRFIGTLCGVVCNVVFPRSTKISLCRISAHLIDISPKKLSFIITEFSQTFLGRLLVGEKDIWFTKNIYQNVELYVDVSHYSQRQFFLYKNYGSHISNYLSNNLNKGDVFLDIGANVGFFSVIASRIVGENGKVYSFEPDNENYEKLTKNIFKNKIGNTETFKVALSDKNGTGLLYLNPLNEGGHSLLPNQEYVTEEVRTIVFDEWYSTVERRMPRIAKIDVEGFELAVLYGMKKTLVSAHNLDLICEVRRNQREVMEFMSSLGYDTYELDQYGMPSKVIDIEGLKRDFLFSKNQSLSSSGKKSISIHV